MRFEHPELLWLVLALPALAWFFLWWTNRARRWLLTQFIQARLLPELTVGESPRRTQGRALLLGTAAALLGLVLARPQWGSSWQEASQKGLDIVVAVDTSKSMLAEDIRPNRLARAKLAAMDLMRLAQADRLGLIAFAGGAFLQCPLTLDDGVFKQCVDDLNVNIIPQGGTAVAEAIRTATQALKDDQNFQVLVLFTDGEDHDQDAVTAAREASEAGLRIYTIGLGTPEGELLRITDPQGKTDFVRDREGQVVKSRLNEALLQEIASAAQGFYLPLRGADTMDVLYEQGLAPLPKSESEARLYRRYHERYHGPLGLALLLIIAEILWPRRSGPRRPQRAAGVPPAVQTHSRSPKGGMPRRNNGGTAAATSVAAVALGLLILSAGPAYASPSSAQGDFESGDFATALEEYDRLREKDPTDARLHFNAGAAAYRAGQFDAALDRFTAAIAAPQLELQQQAYYNRGNAHYRAGEQQQDLNAKRKTWEQALADYEAALKLNTEDAEAQYNLDYVKRKIEELEQQQQQQQNQDKQDNQDQQDQSEQNQDQQNQQSQQNDQQQQQQQNQDQQQQDSQSEQNQQQADNNQDQQQPQQDQSEQNQEQRDQANSPSSPEEEQEQSAEKAEPREPGEPGLMTPEEARRLLDALKGDEQMLPVMVPQPRQPPAKDW